MSDHDKILSWFQAKNRMLEGGIFGAWIIGSYVTNPNKAKDCDILFIVDQNKFGMLAEASSSWRDEFLETFGLPLHMTRITLEEMEESHNFLQAVFDKSFFTLFFDKTQKAFQNQAAEGFSFWLRKLP